MSVVFESVAEIGLADAKTPFAREIAVLQNIVYKAVDGEELCLDLYLPPRPIMGKTPVVFVVPGGAWMVHNRRRRDGYARLHAIMGAAVVVIDYRLCPAVHFPDDLRDVVDAINFLPTLNDCCNLDFEKINIIGDFDAEKMKDGKFNLDLGDVTVTGDSAGGHLAACLGCAASNEEYRKKLGLSELSVKPKRIITVSGVFNIEKIYRIPLSHTAIVRYFSGRKTRTAFRNWEYCKESNPCNYLNKDFPTTYNSGGMTDFMTQGESKRLSEELKKVGVETEYCIGRNILNSFHCYIMRLSLASARRDMIKLMTWYCNEEKKYGVDLSEGFARVEKFLKNRRAALKGKIEC